MSQSLFISTILARVFLALGIGYPFGFLLKKIATISIFLAIALFLLFLTGFFYIEERKNIYLEKKLAKIIDAFICKILLKIYGLWKNIKVRK